MPMSIKRSVLLLFLVPLFSALGHGGAPSSGGGPQTRCDSDGDGVPDTGWQCATTVRGKKNACKSCDTTGDGKPNSCPACPSPTGAAPVAVICPPCLNSYTDAIPTICYSTNCGVNQLNRAYRCWHHGFQDYTALVANCPGTLVHRPSFTPAPNGCGPAGGPAVPNNPCGLGGTSFVSACNEHDIGYGTCGRSKSDVDGQFLIDMLTICIPFEGQFCLIPYPEHTCRALANIYASAVDTWGQSAYESAQFEACICCQ